MKRHFEQQIGNRNRLRLTGMGRLRFRTYSIVLLLLSSAALFQAAPYTAFAQGASSIEYDFEEFAAGDPITSYTKDGLTMTVSATALDTTTALDVVAFDSANPTCDDPDLGTPNEDFGGPGEGAGGEIGQPGANSQSLGMVMIIQEPDPPSTCVPDDNAGGGIFTLQFPVDTEVTVNFFQLIDIDANETGFMATFYDMNGTSVGTQSASAYGNNSYEEFVLNIGNVNKIVISMSGSGAVPSLVVTPDSDTAGLGDYVWGDGNKNGIQDDGDGSGLNNVVVNLLHGDGSPVLDGNNLPVTTITVNDSNGNAGFYQFLELAPGTYIVEFIEPDGYTFTTQKAPAAASFSDNDADTTSGRSDSVVLASGDYDPTIDAGLVLDGVLAVSLSYVHAQRDGDAISFVLETATETGNAGFNVYMVVGSEHVLVNEALIPSSVIDSVEPVRYTYVADVVGELFSVEMVDISGGNEIFGPFVVGSEYGVASTVPSTPTEISSSLFLPVIMGR